MNRNEIVFHHKQGTVLAADPSGNRGVSREDLGARSLVPIVIKDVTSVKQGYAGKQATAVTAFLQRDRMEQVPTRNRFRGALHTYPDTDIIANHRGGHTRRVEGFETPQQVPLELTGERKIIGRNVLAEWDEYVAAAEAHDATRSSIERRRALTEQRNEHDYAKVESLLRALGIEAGRSSGGEYRDIDGKRTYVREHYVSLEMSQAIKLVEELRKFGIQPFEPRSFEDERDNMAEAHSLGLHDDFPREFCPECERTGGRL